MTQAVTAAAILVLTACGSSSPEVTAPAGTPTTTAPVEETPSTATTASAFVEVDEPKTVKDCNVALDRPTCLSKVPGYSAPLGASPGDAPVPPASAPAAAGPRASRSGSTSFEGSLDLLWAVADRGEPVTCGSLTGSYQVQLRDGANAITSVGSFTTSVETKREVEDGVVIIDCVLTYELPAVEQPVYKFVVVARSAADELLDEVVVSGADLAAKGAPKLRAMFSCYSSPCGHRTV